MHGGDERLSRKIRLFSASTLPSSLNPSSPNLCCPLPCRKVKDESATGSSTANRVRTVLTISVESIEFDTAACELRVKGRNIQENQYVKVGMS